MKVYSANLAKQRLAAMPSSDRSLLLLLGHAMNELNVLTKILLTQRKQSAPHPLVEVVESGQNLIIFRLIIGTLHEAWDLFKARVLSNRGLSSKYLPLLDAQSIAALDDLKVHFGKGSVLSAIRNKISFHYRDDANLIEENFNRVSDSEAWLDYFGERPEDNFYTIAERVVTESVISLVAVADSDTEGNMVELARTAVRVSGQIVTLFNGLAAQILVKNFADGIPLTEIDIPDGPKLATFFIPFYYDTTMPLPLKI